MFKIFSLIKEFFQSFVQFILSFFKTDYQIRLENNALRSQLALFQEKVINKKIKSPRVTNLFRLLWIFLSKYFKNWKSTIMVVKPDTVIGWHRKAFKLFWKFKSKRGRPKISMQTIALIKRIHKENPLFSPKKIHEQLVNQGVIDAPAPNSIKKYLKDGNKKEPDAKKIQSWKTFLKNHSKNIWAIDFFTVPTLFFKVLYVFVVISHERRIIEHVAVTDDPNSVWVAQQIREATPFGKSPKYLIHDRGSYFTSMYFQDFLKNANIKAKKTSVHAPYQNAICERVIGTFRRELLNYIIPINKKHLLNLVKEYVEKFYNPHRTHQGINCETPIASKNPVPTLVKDTKLKATPILSGLYHTYSKVA